MYVPIERVLLRAPLLREREWRKGGRALEGHALGLKAIEIASPELAGARGGERRERAINRYGRRAAFRATPSGLLAGVCMGRLGKATRIGTGKPRAWLAPSWGAVDEAARRLLEDARVRERVKVRVAPSVLRGAAGISWVGPGDPFGEGRVAPVDERLAGILAAAEDWRAWGEVRNAVGEDPEGADELLLTLIDDGVLQSELAPPLVGPPAGEHLEVRLRRIGMPDEIEPALSGAVEQAVLVHQPAAEPTLSRAAVERAARLVPLLVRLQEALAPPAAERLAQAPVADALDAVTEIFGAGAFRLGALAAGDYGVELAGPGDEGADGVTAAPDVAAVASVLNQIAGAARRGDAEVAIDPAILAEVHVALPPTAELFLGPTAARAGQRPGSGWLLGLHAPAGASLGRFAHALGAPLTEALGDLAEAERRLAPETETVDVAFTPSPALGDLAAHPKIGGRTLALSRWNAADDLAARDLDLVADPSAPEDLALRTARGELVRPAPLARIRSATAPQGAFRLLAGWSLQRQHAPWALPLGPLAALSFVPRLTLDGFVVAPATWRLPTSTSRAALARWRQDLGVPRLVQVGTGDELLPVDLDATAAPADLAGQERVFEIWPPVGATADRDGRRIEAVVMVVDAPEPDTTRMHVEAAGAARALERVAPPTELGPAQGWRTFKLFGATARRDELLCDAIVPAIRAGLAGREIDRWFFLPYVDGPGRRPHLRLRVHGPGAPAAFEARLSAALGPSRSRGAWATMETSDYFPERGRFRRDELPSLHAIFESDSELCAALLDGGKEDEAFERIVLAARAADALARGLGFDLEARLALALERRRAAEAASALDDEARRAANAAFRTVGRGLREALSAEPAGPFAEHVRRVADAAHALPAGGASRLAPTLLHLGAVRLLGPDPDGERLGYTFWQRTVEGLSRQRGPRRP